MSNIAFRIKNFIVENYLFGEEIGLDNSTSFMEKGIVDSTGILELIEFISTEFQITIDDEELLPENFDSIQRIADFLDLKTKRAVNH